MNPDSAYLDRYELRPANRVTACGIDHPGRSLYTMMKENRFGSAFPLVQKKGETLHEPEEPRSYTGFPTLSLRLDGDFGVSFVLPGWKYRAGYYILPKINVYGRESSAEALITPNASQFFSWYGTVGVDQTNFEQVSFVDEIGIKVRFRIEGKARKFLSLNYRFAGVRVGIRNKGFRHPDSQILVEVGAGVW